MRYRRSGKLGRDVSALGFGCMRLPTRDGIPQSEAIDESETIRMIRHAVDQGVNYIDTAYPYHNGRSEVVTGKALQDGYRAKVMLATKSPVWQIAKPSDFDTYLDEQLGRLGTDHIDVYLFHALGAERWETIVLRHGLLERAEAAVKDGRIGHIGFSFHDKADVFKRIVDGYGGWDMCQIQYNYMDTANQAGTQGLQYAASKDIAVVVMEPLLGGRLAAPPPAVADIFRSSARGWSPAEWALQWIWDQSEVSTALSGMKAMAEVEENLRAAGRSGTGSLGAGDFKLFERAGKILRERAPIPCTQCGYCRPCPSGVNIPRNFELYNDCVIYDDPAIPRVVYARFMPEGERAGACTGCRTCEEKCPQRIAISECLPEVHAVLGQGRAPKPHNPNS
ncbi:MAG TPA: aldo/keto reductase [Acidobacteriota bacterium]|nr:aldo/keto reductase [Acidobacteriota bacterium]